jgi:hypothetical protein
MPHDTSCRPHHGGCGRQVIIVREPFTPKPFGPQFSNRTTRKVAIHDDELAEKPDRVVIRVTGDAFNKLRLVLELACAARQEHLKDSVKAAHA